VIDAPYDDAVKETPGGGQEEEEEERSLIVDLDNLDKNTGGIAFSGLRPT